jgi:stearoyl-CoA desaturase (Delta-9 desaturase)
MATSTPTKTLLDPDKGTYLQRLRDVFKLNHRISKVNSIYLTMTHIVAALSFLAFMYGPEGFSSTMVIYLLLHVTLAVLSTTAYAHRMVSHRATKSISLPVHLFFGYIGQTLAVQGSVGDWAGRHRVHHAVDGNRKHETDPYSAIWFKSTWQNFLWSHVLCYFFEHPEVDALYRSRTKAVLSQHSAMELQHRWYLFFLIVLNYAMPFVVGMLLGGSPWAGLCLMWMSVLATVIIQNITWTVNSFTHLFGIRAARSSARNNYFWLMPLGEGNHHADHHDAPTDYRNGFGFLGWCLDPTRYVLIALRGLRLIGPLQRTPKSIELRVLAERKMLRMKARYERRCTLERWQPYEAKLAQLKQSILERAKRLDALKVEKSRLLTQRSKLTQAQLKEKLAGLKLRLGHARNELEFSYQTFRLELKGARRALALSPPH